MDLVPCNDLSRQKLVDLCQLNELGMVDKDKVIYVAKTFPDILLDVARLLTEQATAAARTLKDSSATQREQLRPYLIFSLLLGKSPQVTSLMYAYFEQSSFQPLPKQIFDAVPGDNGTVIIRYTIDGFSNELVKEILFSYIKYLSFNPKWFSSIWNWAELGRFVALHTDIEIRYIAACCLSIITQPSRHQHWSLMREIISTDKIQTLIDLQIKYRSLYYNTFTPCIETKREKAQLYAQYMGKSVSGYSFCQESIAQLANILLPKRDTKPQIKASCEAAIKKYIPVPSFKDTISRIAYSISIDRPCLVRGTCGSGKTSLLDYIAAHTNRLNPPDYVKIQIGDQIDSKLLIGSYVCTEIPGQFEWQPGPLTRAMAYGSWIVFEDIDMASSDMAQVIHSVIENRNLSCVSCCPIKLDSPHPDFRIFFTQRTQKNKSNTFRLGFGFVEKLCDIVDLPDLTDQELMDIIESLYSFGPLTQTMVKLYRAAEESTRLMKEVKFARMVTTRDLFKLCTRIRALDLKSVDGKYSTNLMEFLFLDTIDCFLASLSSDDLRLPAEELGSILNIPSNEVQRLLVLRTPPITDDGRSLIVGRVMLKPSTEGTTTTLESRPTLAYTKPSLQLMESISLCIKYNEPVLLVGETGVGKTSVIQHLAKVMNTNLVVMNLSQQSDSSDLLGGYKPVELRQVMKPINDRFCELFRKTFDNESNRTFMTSVENSFATAKTNLDWLTHLKLSSRLCLKALEQPLPKDILSGWKDLANKVRRLSKRLALEKESPMALSFSEGTLLTAVKEGKWLLLDEINLAEPEALQCLLSILDSLGDKGVYLHNYTAGEVSQVGLDYVPIHPNFRIFACMNPSTDIGKRDLDSGTRSRFCEFFVNDITEQSDLRKIVHSYVGACLKSPQIESIINFYLEIRTRACLLSDISGNSPVYSLRTLCRALTICSANVCHNIEKSLYESLKITFLQQLNEPSIEQVLNLMEKTVFTKKDISSIINLAIPMPVDDHQYVAVEGFWIQTSCGSPEQDDKYIVTDSVRKNLSSLARIISLSQRKLPILIQGNTSVGKTSLIMYLAKLTGNRCYRINNHEHTDLQDYVGRYVLKESGDMKFEEGLLVQAMKKGYWIILDELNLAPCELLEALNRVLDDNRELFIPETREIVRAHSKFMLFATQNPPQEYAGRKLLSRAFRNRFIELHFDELPIRELEEILHKRCEMAPQHAKKIANVMKELQMFRRESGCFNGKNGFMTLRDLFRWGDRYAAYKKTVDDNRLLDWDMQLAGEGLILLEGRVRTVNEADIVKGIIEKVFKTTLNRKDIYNISKLVPSTLPAPFSHIRFSFEFKKLFMQLSRALKYKEPVLLCGQTGCGKTTACQIYAALKSRPLITYNCHQNTESSDFVGGVRPTREDHDGTTKQTFPWVDGPLVESMKKGSIFLMDEISLADDAVLERVNSVLEPGRSITLTEKSGEEIHAKDTFRLVATMNPGGDYGKKELSPALRNRFTEIYCHNTTDLDQITRIITACLSNNLSKANVGPAVLETIRGFLQEYYSSQTVISIRDVVSLCRFINKASEVSQPRPLSIQEALINGIALVFLDQFGTCGHKTSFLGASSKLKSLLRDHLKALIDEKFGSGPRYAGTLPVCLELNQDMVKFKKFYIQKGPLTIYEDAQREFIIEAPIVRKNLMKIVRALQLDRPILLEGNPGAGKTSVVAALAKLTGHELVRINLSEQTDISDLFGTDLPDSSASATNESESPKFKWHDGPMLSAIKRSQWILLDEMNLASQSILEGLNACFDHRGEIYIPELNKKIQVDRTSTRVFACQNPYNQGAARKGLPQSFLNRFTSIYIESHGPEDLIVIIKSLYPQLPHSLVKKMIEFNSSISANPQYSNYEFNLRDVIHWCELLACYVREDHFRIHNLFRPDKFIQFVYLDRLRSNTQRQEISDLFETIFECPVFDPPYRDMRLGEHSFIMARSVLPRVSRPPPHLSNMCMLKYQLPYLESLAKAIEMKKMAIMVGESGVGKRSMVKILAGLTGNKLNIVGANHEMDTVELLGSFEQKSYQREIVDLIERARKQITGMINSTSRKHSARTWTRLFNNIWVTLQAATIRDLSLSKDELMDAYRIQLIQMRTLMKKLPTLGTLGEQGEKNCFELIEEIDRLSKRPFFNDDSMCTPGNFEWIDSILVKSIREGSWLMIENANLMNPATLDRLNSLVEPNGTLSLNEKGSDADGIENIIPHSNFRLILTMSPEHGELSRAMRNRGVEIYVQPRFYFEDFLMLLDQNGFEPENEKACMAYCIMQTSYDSHKEITGESPEEDGSLLAYFALNFTSILPHQVRRGMNVEDILADLLIAYYSKRGYGNRCDDIVLRQFITDKMNVYRETYQVNFVDERYKWRDLRHDFVALTGGDAIPSMLEKERRIFFEDVNLELLFKPDEMIECIDIVNTCINVKIFLELSTHGDFEYRKGFIKETFQNLPTMMDIVNSHVELLQNEFFPVIDSLVPKYGITPFTEMHIDTRNSPDIHYYLQSLDYESTLERESYQNRWLLSLYRIMLRMIIDLIEERSKGPGLTSLLILSENVRMEIMNAEDLIRPEAKIATDIYDLLTGLLRVVSNRCFDNETVKKILPKLFWINYFICKLKKHHNKVELVAVCNQLPMLWALTYHKVIEPMVSECKLADLNYKNKRFSIRIRSICEHLDMTLSKPGHAEKVYYAKVINTYALTQRISHSLARGLNKFFANLIGRYTNRSQSWPLDHPNQDTLAVSGLVWSKSRYMQSIYDIEDKILLTSKETDTSDQYPVETAHAYEEVQAILTQLNNEFLAFENTLGTKDENRAKFHHVARRNIAKHALDQFSPIWQLKFIKTRLSKLIPTEITEPSSHKEFFRNSVRSINGIIVSPDYYGTLVKYFERLEARQKTMADETIDLSKIAREDADMYSVIVTENLIENIILDNQVVGWTKLRIYTSDLSTLAPIMPEYSPIISLVGSYCLDLTHLKLSSNYDLSHQTESVLAYLWRNYSAIKLDSDKDVHDLEMAKNLLHLRSKVSGLRDEKNESRICEGPVCTCVEEYIKQRIPLYTKLEDAIREKLPAEDFEFCQKSITLIYFGQVNYIEYAPLFTLDPSLRSREKLEVYRSELAHIKLDLHFRNSLFYWKTGENLQLNEIDADEAASYPFSTRILVERRVKLEKSINRLKREFNNRPKSDDGSRYYELRREVEIHINRYTSNIQSIMNDLADYCHGTPTQRKSKLTNLVSRCRMIIKSLEKTVTRFKSEYAIYSDLINNFLAGMCFVHQGLRLLYARLEQKMQISLFGFNCSTEKYLCDIGQLFSFNNFNQGNIESVYRKLRFFNQLGKLCPQESLSSIQSIILRTVLIQLNHHIVITPSDIKRCFPIVRQISDLFNDAWNKRKLYLEQQRKLNEDLYQYKVARTVLGTEISYERQEFLDICALFPTYDHIYQEHITTLLTSSHKENLQTEEKICNMKRSVDLSMCIDICKAHYKFIKEASRNLMGQVEKDTQSRPDLNLEQLIQLEAETFYAVTRHCIPTLDRSFDSMAIECHLMQAKQLGQQLLQTRAEKLEIGSLKSSIEILDEKIFDIHHDPNVPEALRFQKYISKLDERIDELRQLTDKSYDNHAQLLAITKLTSRISSFLITEPLMKFITGAHTLLEKVEQWNSLGVPRSDKMIAEVDELIDLIKSWRSLEVESWRSSLHRVKRSYIDSTFCDLWFELYQAFNDPVGTAQNLLRSLYSVETFELTSENQEQFYQGFCLFVKHFIEASTKGDYQIRLDLVFSFAIQTRFASLYEQAQPDFDIRTRALIHKEGKLKVDFEKLTTYVYNMHRQYQGLFGPVKGILEAQEAELSEELKTEIRIVSWQGRNLWEIKNNFRISHRKLNKVMRKYLEILREPSPSLGPEKSQLVTSLGQQSSLETELESDKLKITLDLIQVNINEVNPWSSSSSDKIAALGKADKIIEKLKVIHTSMHKSICDKYIGNLESVEQTFDSSSDAILNFLSHKVGSVVINPKDSKEIRQEKEKLCRQMYHSKKYSMQSIFKSLQQLGVSYQRGLNSQGALDYNVLSLEPLRGMVQIQSRSVLTAARKLVNDEIITQCNEKYRKLLASFMQLSSIGSVREDLTGDQMSRMRGLALDMMLDSIRHNKNAALIFSHMIDIQAATTRLNELQQQVTESTNKQTFIFNYNKVHKIVQRFNELVSRAYLAIIKLDELAGCYKVVDNEHKEAAAETNTERFTIHKLTLETPEEYALLTSDQYAHIKLHIDEARNEISTISEELRNKLNYSKKNHLYSIDDLEQLQSLYLRFHTAFRDLLGEDDVTKLNAGKGTVLGSIKSILTEAEEKLKPDINSINMSSGNNRISLEAHPQLDKLDLRLKKLIRQIMLAIQGINREEQEVVTGKQGVISQVDQRRMKPFNRLDSTTLRNLLRLSAISKLTGDCFMTLNNVSSIINVDPIVKGLTPILSIYLQNVSCYLNIILSALNVKLNTANLMVTFFMQLMIDGFGLPYKVSDPEVGGDAKASKGEDGESAGFGEGQGDKDASKKLEFESQLDDLRKEEGDDEKEKNKTDTRDIQAHDDGVEMSEDIDASAQGADDGETDANGEKKERESSDEDDDRAIEELDKEMDTVDQDENKLDEKLWDEKDDNCLDEKDDEEDLRETNLDQSMRIEKDEPELQAKDDKLAESTETKTDSEMKAAPTEDIEDNEDIDVEDDSSDQKRQDDIVQAPGELEGDEPEQLDLNEEAETARKEDELKQQDDQPDLQDSEPTQEMDMSFSDDDMNILDKGVEQVQEKSASKEEGEVSEGEESEDGKEELSSQQQTSFDDLDIDQQLEVAVEHPFDEQEVGYPIEDRIRNLTADSSQPHSGPEEVPAAAKPMEGQRVGSHTIYDVYSENDDDPLNFDDYEPEKPERPDEQDGDQEKATLDPDAPDKPDDNVDAALSARVDDAPAEDMDDGKSGREDKEKSPDGATSAKRTLAESENKDISQIKRQKIQGAKEKEDAQDPIEEQNEPKDQPPQTESDVRHTGKNQAPTFEVIDLVSSEDEDALIDEPSEELKQQQSKLKPRESERKEGRHQPKEASGDCMDVEVVKEEEKQSENQPNEPSANDDAVSISSASSVESGELVVNNDTVLNASVRDLNTSYNTNLGLLKYISLMQPAQCPQDKMMEKIDRERESVDTHRLTSLWLDCTRQSSHLVHELCQQLQIVLQPTKMSKYKGDYKTGKRLNMRKIISYIASHYRKDKIWLRRTKPSKRTYNIMLAVDNSSSMSENNCRQMTFQSLALLAKSLSLIEAGALSVTSFGEQVRCIHEFGQPYMDAVGAQWLRDLRFNETRTSYAKLLTFARQSFAKQAFQTSAGSSAHNPNQVSQLLVLISDGRNVTCEEDDIKRELRQLKSMGVLTLFIIIDDLKRNNGSSLVDVKRPIGFGQRLTMVNYMELFPFPFYVLLRQLETMPSILGDALRQWFELVSGSGLAP